MPILGLFSGRYSKTIMTSLLRTTCSQLAGGRTSGGQNHPTEVQIPPSMGADTLSCIPEPHGGLTTRLCSKRAAVLHQQARVGTDYISTAVRNTRSLENGCLGLSCLGYPRLQSWEDFFKNPRLADGEDEWKQPLPPPAKVLNRQRQAQIVTCL